MLLTDGIFHVQDCSVYSILCYGLCVRFTRDWSVLDEKDSLKGGMLSKVGKAATVKLLDDHKRFLKQKKESPEARKKRRSEFNSCVRRGDYKRAEMFRDGVEYFESRHPFYDPFYDVYSDGRMSLADLRSSLTLRSKYEAGYSSMKLPKFEHRLLDTEDEKSGKK